MASNNADVLLELLSMEQKRVKRLEEEVRKLQEEQERARKVRQQELLVLREEERKLQAQLANQHILLQQTLVASAKTASQKTQENDNEKELLQREKKKWEIRCKGLQSVNQELVQKLQTLSTTGQPDAPSLEAELQFWKNKYKPPVFLSIFFIGSLATRFLHYILPMIHASHTRYYHLIISSAVRNA